MQKKGLQLSEILSPIQDNNKPTDLNKDAHGRPLTRILIFLTTYQQKQVYFLEN